MSTDTKKQQYDYLTEDKPIDGQKYVLLSFLSPEGEGLTGVANCKIRGLKVRGVFGDYEEAKAYCEKLRDTDGKFHVFIGEVGKWLPWDPNPDTAKEENYAEKELNNLMKNYNENREKAAKLYNARKDELLQKTLQEVDERSNKLKKKKKKHRKNKNGNIVDTSNNVVDVPTNVLQMKEEDVKKKQTEIETDSKELKEVHNELSDVKSKLIDTDLELKKLMDEYEKLSN